MGSIYLRLTRVFMALLLMRDVAHSSGDEKPCTFCPGGEDVAPLPDKELNWPVSASNCTMLNAYASSLSADSASCANVQSITTICGCPLLAKACHLCPDGSNVTLPDKKLSFLATSFDGVLLSCEEFDAYLHSIDNSSVKCEEAQVTSSACGCPVVAQGGCEFCRGENMSTPNKTLPVLESSVVFTEWNFNPPTCELFEAILYYGVPAEHNACLPLQHYGYLCRSCSSDLRERALHEQNVIVWIQRIAAALSIFGSSFIIYDIVKSKRVMETMQTQLLVAMSCVDCCSSTAWLLAVTLVPDSTGWNGARGNSVTCTAQGFFIQFGLIVPFCNFALAVYYMLVIIYGWREDQIKKHRLWIIGLPVCIGLPLACAGIPFYDIDFPVCYVGEEYEYIFVTIPISIVIFFASAIMFVIYLKVCRQERRVRRLRSSAQSLPRKVCWQAFWYLMCFYVSWPVFLFYMAVPKVYFYNAFGFSCAAALVMPLQGFMNCLAYFRHRILRCMKRHNMCSLCYIKKLNIFSWSLRASGSSAATSVTATSGVTATNVTAAGATATGVDHQHELKESNSMKHSVTAPETASGTAQAEKQMVDTGCGPSFGEPDANKDITQ